MSGSRAATMLLGRAAGSVPGAGLRAVLTGCHLGFPSSTSSPPSSAAQAGELLSCPAYHFPSIQTFIPGLRGFASGAASPLRAALSPLVPQPSANSHPLSSGNALLSASHPMGPVAFPQAAAFSDVQTFSNSGSPRGFATRAAAQKATHKLKFKGGKIKFYSSLKERFKFLRSSGLVKRWRQGYRHKRTPKSKENRARLRRPATVHKAYADVMKKMGFARF